jgi:hypothetical protein
MKSAILKFAAAALVLIVAGGSVVYGQASFKISYGFIAAGKKLPAGEYLVAPKGGDQIALKKLPDGAEVLVAYTQRLDPPAEQPLPVPRPPAQPHLVFDMVGNFEPSYTEYVTDYVLAELWMPGEQGYLIRAMKGAHQHKSITGQKVGK